jgi:hypothetical protein
MSQPRSSWIDQSAWDDLMAQCGLSGQQPAHGHVHPLPSVPAPSSASAQAPADRGDDPRATVQNIPLTALANVLNANETESNPLPASPFAPRDGGDDSGAPSRLPSPMASAHHAAALLPETRLEPRLETRRDERPPGRTQAATAPQVGQPKNAREAIAKLYAGDVIESPETKPDIRQDFGPEPEHFPLLDTRMFPQVPFTSPDDLKALRDDRSEDRRIGMAQPISSSAPNTDPVQMWNKDIDTIFSSWMGPDTATGDVGGGEYRGPGIHATANGPADAVPQHRRSVMPFVAPMATVPVRLMAFRDWLRRIPDLRAVRMADEDGLDLVEENSDRVDGAIIIGEFLAGLRSMRARSPMRHHGIVLHHTKEGVLHMIEASDGTVQYGLSFLTAADIPLGHKDLATIKAGFDLVFFAKGDACLP